MFDGKGRAETEDVGALSAREIGLQRVECARPAHRHQLAGRQLSSSSPPRRGAARAVASSNDSSSIALYI